MYDTGAKERGKWLFCGVIDGRTMSRDEGKRKGDVMTTPPFKDYRTFTLSVR
jgi:hypothetical protein